MSLRYNHPAMIDHAAGQANLVTYLNDKQNEALGVLAQTADFWTEKGATAYAEAQRSITTAFQHVFSMIGRHGVAIQAASNTMGAGDASVAARFTSI